MRAARSRERDRSAEGSRGPRQRDDEDVAAAGDEDESATVFDESVRGLSNHVVLCQACVVAGPCRGKNASGTTNFVVIGLITLLFGLSYKYIASGIWLQLAPVLYLGCWVVLYFAAYTDPGVLPR